MEVTPQRGKKGMTTAEVIQRAITAFLAALVAYELIIKIIKREWKGVSGMTGR